MILDVKKCINKIIGTHYTQSIEFISVQLYGEKEVTLTLLFFKQIT